MNWNQFTKLIVDNLSDDLLSKEWKKKKSDLGIINVHKTFGHCYLVTETAYHLLGGKEEGWKPFYLKQDGESHWFLKHSSGFILDISAPQFGTTYIHYDLARGKGFLTKGPSKRTKRLIQKIQQSSVWHRIKILGH